MAKKLLIISGTAHYDYLPEHWNRPGVTEVVNSVARLFTEKLQYTRVLTEIGNDPTSIELKTKLDRWLGSNERDSADWVVFYYTGHGELVGGNALYLLTRDYESGFHSSTAFSINDLGTMLIGSDAGGGMRRVRKILLILDTCHSGAGAIEITSKLSQLFSRSLPNSMFYVLAAAFPKGEADVGALATALIESINDETLGGAQQKVISFDQLVPAINSRLRTHKVVHYNLASPEEEQQFFPNPRWIDGLPATPTVAEVRRAAESGEMKAFWGPLSRGVESELQPGYYFTGRERVLRELSAWLQDPNDTRTRIVTGSPGSGKSAILSKIVTLSEADGVRAMPSGDERLSKDFRPHQLDLAIHAKGKTLEEITTRFAAKLGVEAGCTQVLDALESANDPFYVVIDALDEAREPTQIARHLLAPLHSLPKVKLLVGTLPENIELLGAGAVSLDIDQPEYFKKSDLAKYVTARLLCKDEKTVNTPYRGKGKTTLARKIARAVADKAHPNFLIARLVSEDLLAAPQALDLAAAAAIDFPDSVSEAFGRYLARFGNEEQKVRDLLVPLAWAEGQGLPWGGLWAPLASALSHRSYDDDDIHWLLQRAESFVVETLERERSVYRLYHQALANYLRQGSAWEQVQRQVTKTLLDAVPSLADGNGKDWTLAHPYIRTHLAEHAAASGLLADLFNDLLYLLAADSSRLLSVCTAHYEQVPQDIFHVYKSIVHHIRQKPTKEAASYFELAARQNGAKELAARVAALPFFRTWSVPWACWKQHTPHQQLANGGSHICALETASLEPDRSVALVGREDGSVEIWDLAQGTRLVEWKPSGVERVTKLALAKTRQGHLLIASWGSGHFGVYDLASNEGIIPHVFPDDGKVTALCLAELDGKQVCVTAHNDLRLAIWSLPTLSLIKDRPNATGGVIYCLGLFQRGPDTLLFSAGDGVQKLEDARDDSKLRLWSLNDLALVWKDGQREGGALEYADSGVFFERTLVVGSRNGMGPPEIWDLNTRCKLFQGDKPTTRTWLRHFKGECLLISVWLGDHQLTVHGLKPSSDGSQLASTPFRDTVSIQGANFTKFIDLHGRSVLLSSFLGHVCVWDLDELLTLPQQKNLSMDIPVVASLSGGATNSSVLYVGTNSTMSHFGGDSIGRQAVQK